MERRRPRDRYSQRRAKRRPAPAFKGLAIAQVDSNDATSWRLFATNFSQGRVDVFDGSFQPVADPGFVDPTIPEGYVPFGIQAIGYTIYVTYALRNPDTGDDVAGPGNGFVNAFDLQGNWVARVASRGSLNSPWGLAWGSDQFGKYSGHLLIGNFGNGRHQRVRAAAERDLRAQGPCTPPGHRRIESLWAIQFGGAAQWQRPAVLHRRHDENGGLFFDAADLRGTTNTDSRPVRAMGPWGSSSSPHGLMDP